MHLFLDSNIWLSFYHYSSDDLEELKKLEVLIHNNEVTLHVPDQVQFEFSRNREVKYFDALSRFTSEKLDKCFPQIVQAYEVEYRAMRDAIKAYEKAKTEILKRLEKDYREQRLKADGIIKDLFEVAEIKPVSRKALEEARIRMMRRNPPGKDDSHGDAINWEYLLEVVPKEGDLCIVAEDKDWREKGSDIEFSPFLKVEWFQKKKRDLRYYRKLSAFFADRYPQIKVSTELEKELLISQLANSRSFKATRAILNRLERHSDFTEAQIQQIADAATSNNQIYWIGDDADIRESVTKLLGNSLDLLEQDVRELYDKYFTNLTEEEIEERKRREGLMFDPLEW